MNEVAKGIAIQLLPTSIEMQNKMICNLHLNYLTNKDKLYRNILFECNFFLL